MGAETERKSLEVVEFSLAKRSYCVELSYVDEVIALDNLTPIPLAPPGLSGLTCLRGMTYPCVDIFSLIHRVVNQWNQTKLYGLRVSSERIPFVLVVWKIRGIFKIPETSYKKVDKDLIAGIWQDQANPKQLINVKSIPRQLRSQVSSVWAETLGVASAKEVNR